MIEDFQRSASAQVMRTWLQYIPEAGLQAAAASLDSLRSETDLSGIVQKVVSTNRELRRVYQHLASTNSAPQIRELFSNIERFQMAKISKIAMSSAAGVLEAESSSP